MSKNPVVTLVDNNGLPVASTPVGDGTSTLTTSGAISGTVTAVTPASTTVPVALTGADQVVSGTAKDYRGFTIRETTGTTAAVVRIYDNASTNSGTIIEEIGLAPSESAREFYSPGVKTVNGIFVKVVSGAVSGSIRTA